LNVNNEINSEKNFGLRVGREGGGANALCGKEK